MSRIDKLGIRGIRSFGPGEMRRIEFYSPLTLILGQNGCGKTTIIESLKFITTGELPPGCGKGAPFVHDPKIAKDTVVRGQVKLLFKSTKGKLVTASRSVEVTQKAKRLEFNSIDSVITYDGPDGKSVSVSNKCIDFYAELTSLLGVAKPILDSVIFCHQEDSNWPLDEGKRVKEKFDSIFNATRYIKCIDAVRKLRKERMQAAGNMTETLDALRSIKEHAEVFRRELKEVEKNCVSLQREKKSQVEEEEPVRHRLSEISEVENEIHVIRGEKCGKEHQLSTIRELQQELKAEQTENFDCSDAELLILLQDFERNTHDIEANKNEVASKLQRINREIEALKGKESQALLLMGKLEAAHRIHLDNAKQGNLKLSQLVHKYNILGYTDCTTFDLEEASNILKHIEKLIHQMKEMVLEKKTDFESKEAQVQKEIDALRLNETTLEHDIVTLSKQGEESLKKEKHILRKLASNEEDLLSTSLEELNKNIDDVIAKIAEEQQSISVPNITKEIEEKRRKIVLLELELEEVKKKIAHMNSIAETRSQLDIYQKDKLALEQKNQFLSRKNADDFQSLFKGVIGDSIKNELEAKMSTIRSEIREWNEKKSKLERRKTELGTKMENEKHIIAKMEKDIEEFKSKTKLVCGSSELEAAVIKTKEDMDRLIKKKGEHESSSFIYEEFMEKVKAGEDCPLCHRDFEAGYDKEMLVEQIKGKLNRLPHELIHVKKALKEKEALFAKLLQLQSQKERIDKVSEESQSHREKLNDFLEMYGTVCNSLEEASFLLASLLSEEEIGQRVQADVVALDSNSRMLRQLSNNIGSLQGRLGTHEDSSMESLINSQNNLEQKLKTLRQEVESLQEAIMDRSKRLQRLNDQKISLSSYHLELKTKQQETENLKMEVNSLQEDKKMREEKRSRNCSALVPIKLQLREKLDTKASLLCHKEKTLELEGKKIELIRDEFRAAKDVVGCIRAYVEGKREAALDEFRKKLQHLQEQNESTEKKKKDYQEQINSMKDDLAMQKEKKRTLNNEKKIRDKDVEAKILEDSILSLEKKIKGCDYEKVYAEKQRLLIKINKIQKNLANLEGRLEELSKTKKDLEGKLNQKEIKNAEKNYKEKFVEKKCILVACSDLNKYYKALETSIMKFHREKMSNINTIIRELWRSTYKGNDIDYIEIKTDETESQGADKKRNINYRVVMIKNEVEMDMRGRCSAGQKVLASLIIRMALAETFSSSCGILALDEPTTNLDRENIEALSLALLDIVNKRSHQRNLQLVVITHDFEFLERMTRADFIEYYWEVSRDDRGLSVIKKKAAQSI